VRLGTVSLMLSIVLWGTLLGGIAYSHLVFFPVYLSALPESTVLVTGPYALNDARFWMLVHPLLIISLIAALALNWRWKARRRLIGLSFIVYGVMLVATQMYFVPELIAFAQSPGSSVSRTEWLARAQRWESLSWLRGTVCYAAFVPLLLALRRPDEELERARR
jgi:hypothetical protein